MSDIPAEPVKRWADMRLGVLVGWHRYVIDGKRWRSPITVVDHAAPVR